LWYQAAWEGSKAPSLRPSRCPLVVHLAAPLKRDSTMATMNVHPTVQKYLTILSHALNTAVREYGWLGTNVVNTVSRPPLPPGRVRYLSDEERSRLLQEWKKSQNRYL